MNTQRLILRPWKQSDYEPFAALNACEHVCQHLPKTLTRDESDQLADKIVAHFDRNGFGLFALERKDTGEFIGFTGLSIPNFEAPFMPAVEIGWRLAHDHWGQGFATEAAISARDYAFDTLGIESLVSFTTHNNMASRAIMKKIGMTHDTEDDFEHPSLPEGHVLRSHVLYRLDSSSSANS